MGFADLKSPENYATQSTINMELIYLRVYHSQVHSTVVFMLVLLQERSIFLKYCFQKDN